MLLDLIGILNNNGASLDFEDNITFENIEYSGVYYNFTAPMHIKGSITNFIGSLELTAHVNGVGNTVCARCNKPLNVDISYDFKETILNNSDNNSDDDKIIITGSVIDITDLAFNNFLTEASMRYLCKPDCKGLCQYCGADKNVTECDCENTNIDPRLSVLDDLFKD